MQRELPRSSVKPTKNTQIGNEEPGPEKVTKIVLQYSNDMPASPYWRSVEKLARTDRQSLGARFGEPFDPRRLTEIYDVGQILETFDNYRCNIGIDMISTFDGLERWSGLLLGFEDGNHLILVNPNHSLERRNLTIAHEFGHLARSHKPLEISLNGELSEVRYSDEQERDAYAYGLAILLPYAPLLQMLQQRCSLVAIAKHYGVSLQAVEMRIKLLGLWKMRNL